MARKLDIKEDSGSKHINLWKDKYPSIHTSRELYHYYKDIFNEDVEYRLKKDFHRT